MNKKNMRNLFFFLSFFFLSVQGCSSVGGVGGSVPTEEPSEEESYVNMERVALVANVATFDRMIIEGNPDEIFSRAADEDVEDKLLNAGVISVDGEIYRVETDISEWDVTSGPVAVETSMAAVESGLGDILNHNDVTWCGTPARGDRFVTAYLDRYRDAFATNEEYMASIDDYVDCGTGRP